MTDNRKLAWGIFYKDKYTPKGNPKHDLKLTLPQLKRIAKRMAGKPFLLAHSDQHIDNLGSIKQAFVSDNGDLHAQLEFSHDNFHSVLSNNMVANGQIRGLSLSSVIAIDENLDVHSMDEPVEGSLVPLSKARRGEDCEIYKLGQKWLCNDSKRNEYNDVLKKAGLLQTKNIRHFSSMASTEQQQQQQQEQQKDSSSSSSSSNAPVTEMMMSHKRSHAETTTTTTTPLEELEEFKKAYEKQSELLKKYQQNEHVKIQMEEEAKIEQAQTWLDSSIEFIQQLIKDGLPQEAAQKIIANCGAAIKERNFEKLDDMASMMQLVHSSHVHSKDVTTRYMEQLDQSRKMQEDRKQALEDQRKLQSQISKINDQRKETEKNFNLHGISSRVDTTTFKSSHQPASKYNSSLSYEGGNTQKKQKQKQFEQQQQQQQRNENVHYETGTIHRNVSTDRVLNPALEGTNRAPKPRITNQMYGMAHSQCGLGIPATGGMKKKDPESYQKMLGDYKANGYTGHTAFENSYFCDKTFYGGDIPINEKYNFSAGQAPVIGSPVVGDMMM